MKHKKNDLNSFIPAMITIFFSINPARVVIAKDILSFISQSECTFNAIHCISIYTNTTNITPINYLEFLKLQLVKWIAVPL